MRPLIGITTSEVRVAPRLPHTPQGDLEPLLDQLAGVCLSGGPDLDPATYGAEPDPRLGPTWPDLDAYELALARRADAPNVPLLAICRGMQTLNVARGGTLHQHVDGHRQAVPCEQPAHDVRIAARSRLHALVNSPRIDVNSFHHQALATLGDGLRPTAWAGDGIVEAVEATGARFLLGVQWHAEGLTSRPEQHALFSAFVDAARDHATGVHVRAA
jgi:putative glutamine amidotransferase